MQSGLADTISFNKTVSFVIPVKNDAKRLQSCLESIIRQNAPGVDKEIIVLDNGSTDDSIEVAARMGAVVHSAPALSVAQLRNKGALSSKGELIAFVDADHVLAENWLMAGLDVMKRQDCGISGTLCTSPAATWVQRAYDRFRRRPQVRTEVEWLGSGNMLIRKELFLELNGLDESLETCEDVDFCQRARKNGWRIISDPGMESIHFGDPATLKSLFWGELWRGRNNLRVTMKGPITPRAILSLVIPALVFPGIILLLIGFFLQLGGMLLGLPVLLLGIFLIIAPSVLRCIYMSADNMGLLSVFQNFAVAATYNFARALALFVGVSYTTRRAK